LTNEYNTLKEETSTMYIKNEVEISELNKKLNNNTIMYENKLKNQHELHKKVEDALENQKLEILDNYEQIKNELEVTIKNNLNDFNNYKEFAENAELRLNKEK
jgi:hypothetical protein